MDLLNPATAFDKSAHWLASGNFSSNYAGLHSTGLVVNQTSHDGLTIGVFTGNVSGTVAVYGYND